MRWFLRRLYRERRRLFITAVLTYLAGHIAFFNEAYSLFGLPMPVLAGLAFMVGLTGALMGIVVFFPSLRHSAESVAVSIMIMSLMGVFGPQNALVSTSAGLWGILLCYLVFFCYAGDWIDRFLPQKPQKLHSTARTRLAPEQLWPYVAVTPDSPARFHAPDTISLDWIIPGKRYREIGRYGELGRIEEHGTIEAQDAPRRFAFSFVAPDADERAAVSAGHYDRQILPAGEGAVLRSVREYDRVTPRARLIAWMDDAMARLDDDLLARAEAAERVSSRPPSPV